MDEDRLADLLAAYDPTRAGTPSEWAGLDPASRRRLDLNRLLVDRLAGLGPQPGLPLAARPDVFPFEFGRFRVRGHLGAGACGVVYLADDPVLGREVALKMPRPEALASPGLQQRFVREAQAAAILSHPNIVPVFEAGAVGGVCYTAAEYCPGPTLARWMERAGRPIPAGDAAGLVAALAAGIGYAHRRGVVHRDLKPSNVLLDPGADGGPASAPLPTPKIADFGFAKLIERDEAATQTGVVIGTPLYMAPEQAEGRAAAVGPATDVYALGVILFELLTGRQPLVGSSTPDTLRRIVADPPPRPRSLRRDVPRDLEAICRKCLEKDPARRYPDGDALAADLGRFLAGQPTLARPVRWTVQVGMWARRNPAVAALTGAVAAALLLLAAVGWRYERGLAENNAALQTALDRQRAAAADADRQRDLATDRYRAVRRQAYLAEIREAAAQADLGKLTDRSVRAWEPGPDEDLRGFEWRYLTRLARATRTWPPHQGPVTVGRITDDGKLVATVAGREVRVWDVGAGRVVEGWTFARELADQVAVSADGRFAAAVPKSRKDGMLLFTRGEAAPRAIPQFPGEMTHSVAFAGADLLLATVGPVVRVYHAPTGAPAGTLALDRHHPCAVAVGPGGGTVAVDYCGEGPGDAPGPVVLYALPAGREVGRWTVPSPADGMAYAADGRHILFHFRARQEVQVWEVAGRTLRSTHKLPLTRKERGRVVGCLADGRLGAATWLDGFEEARDVELAVWSPGSGDWTTARVVPPCVVQSLAFLPDGRGLLVGGEDSTVHVVDLARPAREVGGPVCAPQEAWAVAVSPDGGVIVTGGDDHAVRVWDARTGARLAARTDHHSLVTTAVFAPAGGWFATGSFDGRVMIRDPRSAVPRLVLKHGLKVRALAVSPDGRAVAAAGETGAVSVWDVPGGRLRYRLEGSASVIHAVAFTGDGKALLAAPEEDELVWWDAATGWRLRGVNLRLRPSCLAVSPDGRTVAVGYETGQVAFLDEATGQERFRAHGSYSRLNGVAFAPDGKTVATTAVDGSVRLWHAGTGVELFAINRGGRQVNGVAFAPDGSFLAAARHDGRLLVWPTGDEPRPDR